MRDEGDSTEKIEVPDSGTTSEIDSEEVPPLVPDHAVPWVRRLMDEGWVEIVQAAALAFLVLLAVGSVLVLAAKLNFPSIGRGGDLLDSLNAIVIAGLSILSVPVIFDDVAIALLPLGALIVTGWGIAWAVRTTIRPPDGDAIKTVRYGARIALPFALLCWFAALVFRYRGDHPVAADGGAVLLVAAFWGALFGALGALQTRRPLRAWASAAWNALHKRIPVHDEGIFAGAVTLVVTLLAAGAATFIGIIIVLARDAPGRHFTAGDAFAYVVYLAALLPNFVISVAAISFGSNVDVGARLNLSGEIVGQMREYSMWTWGRGDPPAFVYLLVLIPLIACLAGGVVARRRTGDPSSMAVVLLTASGVVATSLTLLAWVAKTRLAGIGRGGGYAAIEPDAVVTFAAAFLLTGILGAAGWKLAENRKVMAWIGRT